MVISDNLTTAMTGGQDSAGTSRFEAICIALGVEKEHVRVVVPLAKNMDDITRTIREEIDYKGVSGDHPGGASAYRPSPARKRKEMSKNNHETAK